ncbi:MAG: hypothetical protein AAFW83_05945 [Pseudomonadota bacterium]
MTSLSTLMAISMLFVGVGYPPPSERDVLEVMQRRFHVGLGGFLDPFEHTESYELLFNNYPVDVSLLSCEPYIGLVGDPKYRADQHRNGYNCLIEMHSYAVPAFKLYGVFVYTGTQWRYTGEDKPRSIRPQEFLNRKHSRGRGRFILKPGSLPYNGFPSDPLNDVPSPYDDLLTIDPITTPF